MNRTRTKSRRRNPLDVFRAHGGILRFNEARKAGIHSMTLFRLRQKGFITSLGRGLYSLADMRPQTHPDLLIVSRAAPRAVICLVSALAWHRLTDQIPHAVDCAFPRGVRPPRLAHPPIRTFWFSPDAHAQGVETHTVDGSHVRIYSPEKTIADCFKYRNKIGLDTVLDALRRYRENVGLRSDKLMKYARVCRVQKVMQPYLEASL
ncbi:MAG TPA: type IV toxin-antitoxin system AbiEi family antitoxin domain-containing protein [Kiritimatiellia bacterium]|nr:type IV toxin-antitoxin system AbiEi family antitoxin domain-containing protein [Kiritimatiellia bacterium]